MILSEDSAKIGGMIDMNDVKSEEEMNAKMKNMVSFLVESASGNVALIQRVILLVNDAIERNII